MNYIPETSSEFDELMALAQEDKDVAQTVRDMLEDGLPILLADIGNCKTKPNGDQVFSYRLPAKLKALLKD